MILIPAVAIIYALAMPINASADKKQDVFVAIAEESEGDIVLCEIGIEIAFAESGWNPSAKNSRSTASGIFQFIRSTWRNNCKGDVFDYRVNIECAMRMLKEGGYSHWDASKNLWWPRLSLEAKQRIMLEERFAKFQLPSGLVVFVDKIGNIMNF